MQTPASPSGGLSPLTKMSKGQGGTPLLPLPHTHIHTYTHTPNPSNDHTGRIPELEVHVGLGQPALHTHSAPPHTGLPGLLRVAQMGQAVKGNSGPEEEVLNQACYFPKPQ